MEYKTKISLRTVRGVLYYCKNNKGITSIANRDKQVRFLKLIYHFCKDYKTVKVSDGYICLVK